MTGKCVKCVKCIGIFVNLCNSPIRSNILNVQPLKIQIQDMGRAEHLAPYTR